MQEANPERLEVGHQKRTTPLGLKIAFAGFTGAGAALIIVSLSEPVLYALYCNSQVSCDLYYRDPLSFLSWVAILGIALSVCGLVLFTNSRYQTVVKGRVGISALALGLTLYALSLLAGYYLPINGFNGPYAQNIAILVFGLAWSFMLIFAGYFLFRRAFGNTSDGAVGFNLFLIGIGAAALGTAMIMEGTVNFVIIYSTMNLSGLGVLLSGIGWLTLAFAALRLGRELG